MTIGAALVLFAVVWFMTLFLVLPFHQPSQGDKNDVVPGTSPSAPANPQLGKRAIIVTAISLVIWVILVSIIATDAISLETINIWSCIQP